MSYKPRDRTYSNNSDIVSSKTEIKNKMNISNIIDNINLDNLGTFYQKDETYFKKRIDRLNLKFYMETEKYLNNKEDIGKVTDNLFLILFKQISLYVEEVERLNHLLKEKNENEKSTKEKIEDLYRRDREKSSSNQMISNLRNANKNLEKKLNERTIVEEKNKQEINSLRRQLKFYKDKLQIELTMKKTNDNNMNNTLKSGLSNNNLTVNANKFLTTSNRTAAEDEESKEKLPLTKKQSLNEANPSMSSDLTSMTSQSFYKRVDISLSKPSVAKLNNSIEVEIVNVTKVNKKRNYSDNNANQKLQPKPASIEFNTDKYLNDMNKIRYNKSNTKTRLNELKSPIKTGVTLIKPNSGSNNKGVSITEKVNLGTLKTNNKTPSRQISINNNDSKKELNIIKSIKKSTTVKQGKNFYLFLDEIKSPSFISKFIPLEEIELSSLNPTGNNNNINTNTLLSNLSDSLKDDDIMGIFDEELRELNEFEAFLQKIKLDLKANDRYSSKNTKQIQINNTNLDNLSINSKYTTNLPLINNSSNHLSYTYHTKSKNNSYTNLAHPLPNVNLLNNSGGNNNNNNNTLIKNKIKK